MMLSCSLVKIVLHLSSVDSAQERLLKVYFSNASVSACPSFIYLFFFSFGAEEVTKSMTQRQSSAQEVLKMKY